MVLRSVNGGAPLAIGVAPRAGPHDDDSRRHGVDHPKYKFEVECFDGLDSTDDYVERIQGG